MAPRKTTVITSVEQTVEFDSDIAFVVPFQLPTDILQHRNSAAEVDDLVGNPRVSDVLIHITYSLSIREISKATVIRTARPKSRDLRTSVVVVSAGPSVNTPLIYSGTSPPDYHV